MEQSQFFQDRLQRHELVVKDVPNFDLDNYIANYEGHVRIQRLNYIAARSPVLCIDALHIAIKEARRHSPDPDIYIALTALLHEIAPDDALSVPDVDWVQKRRKENKAETDRLEQELRGYKNNLIKESIRMGQDDIASHYLALSDIDNAVKALQKMREYCTTPKHVAEMTMKVIYANIISRQWGTAQSQCQKARVLSLKPEEKHKFDQAIDACSALAYLGVQDYQAAAKAFLRIDASYLVYATISGIGFLKAVISGHDIAVYGGLTALASMDRAQLRTQVVENANFRSFLELEPHIRRAISLFCDAKYSACLEILESYRNDYLLDMNLGPLVSDLYSKIRSKSIVQFFVPFSHVRIADLAAAFPAASESGSASSSGVQAMEDELASMIQTGILDARIDAVDGILLAPPRELRTETQQGVMVAAADLERGLRRRLHRLNMAHAGLELNVRPRGLKGGAAWERTELGTPMSNA